MPVTRASIPTIPVSLPALVAALLLPVLLATTHAAPVYRWVDEAGRVHYGDQPPPEGAEAVEIPASRPADPGLAERRERGTRLSEIMEEDRVARDGARAAEIEEREVRQARCDSARRRLAEATRASYIYKNSEDPANPVILADAERHDLEQSLQTEVRHFCGAGNAAQ